MTDALQSLRAKYPQYKNLDDRTLTRLVVEKYPQYRDTFAQYLTPTQSTTVEVTTPAPKTLGQIPAVYRPEFTTAPAVSTRELPEREPQGVVSALLSGAQTVSKAIPSIMRGAASGRPLRTKEEVDETLAAPINLATGLVELAAVPLVPAFSVADELTGNVFQKYVEAGMDAWKGGRYGVYRILLPPKIREAVDKAVETAISVAPFAAAGGIRAAVKGRRAAAPDVFDKIEPPPPKDVVQRADLTEASRGLPLAQIEKPVSPIGERPQIVKPAEVKPPAETVGKPTVKPQPETGLKGIDPKPEYELSKLDPQKLAKFQALLDETGTAIKVTGPDGKPLSKTSVRGAIEDWKNDQGKEKSWRAQALFKALDEAFDTGIVEIRPSQGMPYQEIKIPNLLGEKAGEPVKFVKTPLGEQGALLTEQAKYPRPDEGIRSNIPPSKQIEGTMFEKPKPEEPTLFGGFPRLNLRTGLSEKAFEATKKVPVGRKIIEFFSPLSTVPESRQLKAARNEALGDISKVERIVDGLSGRLKKLPEDVKEQMFRVLDGQMPVETLPTEYQGTARLMRSLSGLAGRMLVKRGIISEETFNAHKGKYIHYMYLRHVLGNDIPIGTGGGRLDLSIAKQRKDLTTDQRKALGLIENVSVAIPVGMSKALGDVAKYDYFKTISENPEWTWKPSIIKVGNERFGIGQLADEVATYKTITERFPNNRDVAARYNTLKDALEVTSKEIGKIPKDYEQLPNLKSYGPLRGVVVRKEIAKDIKPMFSIRDNDIGHAARVMVDASAKSVAVFKLGKVPFNLPTVVRNVVSNVIQLNMSGIPLAEVPIWYVKALKQMAEKSPAYQRAFRNGIFKTNWSVQEIGEVLGEFQKIKSGAPHELVLTAQKLARYYGKIDDVTKFAKFLERTENGVSISGAAIEAQKWGMDYSLASRSIKFFRRHVAPFASYSYKIVPLIVETALERPHILAKYVLLPSLITKYAIDRFNISDDDWEKLKKDLPLFIRENKTYTALPWKDEKGNLKWVDIQYFFPWGNLEAAGQSATRGKVGETAQQLGIGSNPLLLVANAFVRRGNPEDPFTGKEIYNDLDTGNEKMAKTLEYLYNLYAPSMLTRYGALGQTLNIGEPQKYGRTTETPDALLRFLGVNIVTPTKEQARANLKAKQAELRSNLYQHLRDPKLTKEERQKYVQRYQEEVLRLR